MRRSDRDRFATTMADERFALAWATHCLSRFDTGSIIVSTEFDAFVEGWHDAHRRFADSSEAHA